MESLMINAPSDRNGTFLGVQNDDGTYNIVHKPKSDDMKRYITSPTGELLYDRTNHMYAMAPVASHVMAENVTVSEISAAVEAHLAGGCTITQRRLARKGKGKVHWVSVAYDANDKIVSIPTSAAGSICGYLYAYKKELTYLDEFPDEKQFCTRC